MAGFDISSQSVFAHQIQPQYPLESEGKYPNINDEITPSRSTNVATCKQRGRPIGAKNKAKQPIIINHESPDAIRAHLLEVQSGCDIFESLAAYARKHQLGISVLTAVGKVTRVTLQSLTVAGAEILPLQGQFEILSISGTFLPPPFKMGATSLTAQLSAGNAQVVGGTVVGPLIACGPVMVMVAAFTYVACETLPLGINDKQNENEQQFLGDGIGGGSENSFFKSTSGSPLFGMQNSLLPVGMWAEEQAPY